ncbi:unnamed protein product [Diamesa serratosioi]
MDSLATVIYLKKAKEEICENDLRKVQALAQFREWISKHPAFKNYRNDDSFFLQFLRARKFNNSRAYELYENYFYNLRKHPKWHADNKNKTDSMMKIIDRGIVYPLSQRDAEGRKVVLFRMGNLDNTLCTAENLFSTYFEVFTQLIEDEDTQISGFVVIIDYTGLSMKHMSIFTISDVKLLADNILNSTPFRFKFINILNIPSFARFLLDIFKMALSDKLRKIITFSKDLEELKLKIDEKLLPKELGGLIPESEMIKELKETIKQNQKKRQEIYDTKVDLNMIVRKKTEDSDTGSFRKLEVD